MEAATFIPTTWPSNMNYQFTRQLSLRFILDYNGVLPNSQLIDYERSKTLTGNLLLAWLINPSTGLYVGYTNTHQNLALFPGAMDCIAPIGPPSTATGREVFVKLSYLIRR